MEPISLIITALAFGAAEVTKGTLGEAGKDTYNSLKECIFKHFAGNAQAESALEDHEGDPETYEKPLAKALQQTRADQDVQILEQAKRLLDEADPAGTAAGKYTVTVTGGQGVVIGDNAGQTNYFGPQPTPL